MIPVVEVVVVVAPEAIAEMLVSVMKTFGIGGTIRARQECYSDVIDANANTANVRKLSVKPIVCRPICLRVMYVRVCMMSILAVSIS